MKPRTPDEDSHPSSVGRYRVHQPIARGGMATVHAARYVAAEGVTRLVAAKRLHSQYADDPEFVTMFHDEARIASRIHHPNVVPVLDVVLDGEEVILVQEYVHGVPLSYLMKRAHGECRPIALPIVLTMMEGVLLGLHAAHEATDEVGDPLGIVHRDVSPQNVLISVDGIPRLVDFGIAKAKTSEHHTREGLFKGKLSYMPPEQLRGESVTRAADIYAAGVLLWELVVNRRFHDGKNDPDFVRGVATGSTMTPTQALAPERDVISLGRWAQVERIEPIIKRAMAVSPDARYGTAAEMAAALAEIAPHAPTAEVAAWVRSAGAEFLEKRQQLLLANEESARDAHRPCDEGARSSGARMRIDAVRVDVEGRSSVSPGLDSLAPTTGSFSGRPGLSVRSYVPLGLSAGLLVILGVLAGVAIRSDPAVTTARSTTHDPQGEISAPEMLPATASVDPGAPKATQPVIDPGAPAPTPSSPPPGPSASPVVRSVAPARVAPATPPRPVVAPALPATAPPQSKQCNPPFYFEGNVKVFKPSCI